ncbi:MAG: hypothetical protein CYG60_15830 [Actinobacteria bacterium]|nr:MAG: hypothetical protein CYG60_15830 [Actinomycetota bacterium]
MSPPGRPLTLLPGGRLAIGDAVLVHPQGEDPRTATVVAADFSTDVFRDDVVVAYPDGTRDLVDARAVRRRPRTATGPTEEPGEGMPRRAEPRRRSPSREGAEVALHGTECVDRKGHGEG